MADVLKTTKKIACVVGTRPEAIKMAPLVRVLRQAPDIDVKVLATGQHSEMLLQVMEHFNIRVDADLAIMKERQSLDHITAAVLEGVGAFLDARPQDMVLVHGDTTTTLAATLAAFYRKIPTGHVEAGLRSNNLHQPFPEEANRVLTDRLTTLFFAPTAQAAENLIGEGVDRARIAVTGNTVIDALFQTIELPSKASLPDGIVEGAPLVLLTAHRRESWGEPMVRICGAVRRIAERHPEHRFLFPMHKNPAVRETVTRELADCPHVVLTEPLDYPSFVAAMNRSTFIMSDSGGIQEEASAIGKPVLILRELSERPEALTSGTGILVGTDQDRIVREALRLLEDENYLRSFAARKSPFGDGTASLKILDFIRRYFAADRNF